MSQQAFFSTAGSETIGQSQIPGTEYALGFGSVPTPFQPNSTVLYQTPPIPSLYAASSSSFNTSNAFFTSNNNEERKDYLAMLSTGNVELTDTSGLVPALSRTSLTSVSSPVDSQLPTVAQLTPVSLSHVQLAPVQTNDGILNNGRMHADDRAILYEQYFIESKGHPVSSILSSEDISLEGEHGSCISSGNEEMETISHRYMLLNTDRGRKDAHSLKLHVQNRKNQCAREIEELNNVLRQSNDIEQNSNLNDELRERRAREKRAEAARQRYRRMNSEERRSYNQRKRMKQCGLNEMKRNECDEKIRQQILQQNARKAEAARMRYHRMSTEEKRIYNQKRTEAFRRRRIEEEILLSTPAGRISAEALCKAQQIMQRNAKRAEAARQRYQRMSQEERKAYNQRRSSAKKARERSLRENYGMLRIEDQCKVDDSPVVLNNNYSEEVLCALERDVAKRTRQANMVLSMKQKSTDNVQDQVIMVSTSPSGTQGDVYARAETDSGKEMYISSSVQENLNIDASSLAFVNEPLKQFSDEQTVQSISANSQIINFSQHLSHCTSLERSHVISVAVPHTSTSELHGTSTSAGNIVSSGGRLHLHREQNEQMTDEHSQPVIVAVRESQHHPSQIIVTDPNQPTGVVLSSINSNVRQRGRPPLYAAAAAFIHQQHLQPHHHSQDNEIAALTTTQLPVTSSSFVPYDTIANRRSRHANCSVEENVHNISNATSVSIELTAERKLEMQRARRAERARLRYHNMSHEERRLFNARRADALRKARLRDEQLCQLAETNGIEIDATTLCLIEEAQRRRARRAEAARQKYHRMSSEERRHYNALRDAQRRLRKQERERREEDDDRCNPHQHSIMMDPNQEHVDSGERNDGSSVLYETYNHYDDQIESDWTS